MNAPYGATMRTFLLLFLAACGSPDATDDTAASTCEDACRATELIQCRDLCDRDCGDDDVCRDTCHGDCIGDFDACVAESCDGDAA